MKLKNSFFKILFFATAFILCVAVPISTATAFSDSAITIENLQGLAVDIYNDPNNILADYDCLFLTYYDNGSKNGTCDALILGEIDYYFFYKLGNTIHLVFFSETLAPSVQSSKPFYRKYYLPEIFYNVETTLVNTSGFNIGTLDNKVYCSSRLNDCYILYFNNSYYKVANKYYVYNVDLLVNWSYVSVLSANMRRGLHSSQYYDELASQGVLDPEDTGATLELMTNIKTSTGFVPDESTTATTVSSSSFSSIYSSTSEPPMSFSEHWQGTTEDNRVNSLLSELNNYSSILSSNFNNISEDCSRTRDTLDSITNVFPLKIKFIIITAMLVIISVKVIKR